MLEYLDIDKLNAIEVGVFEAIGGYLLVLIIILLRFLLRIIRDTYTSDLRHYIGHYTGFRATGNMPQKIISPKIEITHHWRRGFLVHWLAPNSHTAVEFKISRGASSREIYCTHVNSRQSRQGFLILHKNYDNGREFICGHYLFLNQLNEVVSGNLLLLKKAENWPLFEDTVKIKCIKDEARLLWKVSNIVKDKLQKNNEKTET